MYSYNQLLKKTQEVTDLWREHSMLAPQNVAIKLDNAMLEWLNDLTRALIIWISKGNDMTDGELILARVNLGAVLEFWLKFFYTIHYEDYRKDEKAPANRQGLIEPEKASFEQLKSFARDTLLGVGDNTFNWITTVQQKRNAIHSFKFRDIGTSEEFLEDINKLNVFVDSIIDKLPPIEDIVSNCC